MDQHKVVMNKDYRGLRARVNLHPKLGIASCNLFSGWTG